MNNPKYAENQRNKIAQLKSLGICLYCAKVPARPGKRMCKECSSKNGPLKKYQKNRRIDSISKGLCYVCRKDPFMKSTEEYVKPLCRTCFLKAKSGSHLKSRDRWKELEDKLIAQDYKCVYTGETIILGVNDSLDHKLPFAHFPENRYDMNNLEWVTRKINQVKTDISCDDFLILVRNIFIYRNLK